MLPTLAAILAMPLYAQISLRHIGPFFSIPFSPQLCIKEGKPVYAGLVTVSLLSS